jgi:hypothetical protein
MDEKMTVNTGGWHKQPHYTQHALDVMERIVDTQPIADIRDLESELTEVLMRGLQGGLFEADMVKLLDGLTESLLEEV